MNEPAIYDDRNHAREQQLVAWAEQLAQDHHLGERVFSCEDERREAIDDIMAGVLGDEQRAVVLERLRELAGPNKPAARAAQPGE